MKPAFAYYGGKVGMARRIVELLPPHRVYLEPFLGSGAVFFAKEPARMEILNDVDRNVVTFFRVLRERPDDLAHVCALTPYARDEWAAADMTGELDDLERARRFWCRINQSFAKTAGIDTGWSITTARTQSPPATCMSRLGRFAAIAERLAGAMIENGDAVDVIERMATDDATIYVDPPYLASTRRGGRGVRASDYAHDMGDEASHERLAECLHRTPAAVVLSGYPSPLYEALYGDWWHVDVAVTAHSSNALTAGRTGRVERIWCNRAPAHTLFAC